MARVTCPNCDESILLTSLNRHWSHTPGHASASQPRPPTSLFTRIENTLDVDDGENDLRFLVPQDPPISPRCEDGFGYNDDFEDIEEDIRIFPNAGQPSAGGIHYVHPQQERREAFAAGVLENPYFPYANSAQYYLAETFARPNIQSKDRIHRGCVLGEGRFLREDAAFGSYNEFMAYLDSIRDCQAPWEEREVPNNGERKWSGSLKYWRRDPLAVLQEMLENPALKDHCVWGPVREYNEENERIYTDLHTGDRWWNIQLSGKAGVSSPTVIAILMTSDKTQLGSLSGNASAWPLYMSLGNVTGKERFRKESRCMRLIGLLPSFHGVRLDDCSHEEYKDWKRSMFHEIIGAILQPLADVMEDGINLLCPDGERRHCFPVVFQYIADYEEQRSLASIVSGYCPKCTIPSFPSHPPEHRFESTIFPSRIQQEAVQLRQLHAAHPKELKPYGLKSTQPFTKNLPLCDIHEVIAIDILHGVSKCFFDYVHKWIISLIEGLERSPRKVKGEIDARFSHLAPFRKLKAFRQGISCLPRWTGAEYKAMSRVYLGVIKGLVPDEAVKMVKHYLDIQRLAHYESHTESTLRLLDEAVEEFWDSLMARNGIFLSKEVVPIGWYCPKLHLFRHYSESVRDTGVLPFCSTDRTEAYHRPIKDSYRASNKGPQASEFIVKDEARDFGWEIWEQNLKKHFELEEQLVENEDFVDEDEMEDDLDEDEPRSLLKTVVKKTITLSKKRRFAGWRELGIIARANGFSNLEEDTRNFLLWIRGNRGPKRKRRLEDIEDESRLEIQVSNSAFLVYPTVHDPYTPVTDVVYAAPTYAYFQNKDWVKPRYDTVLIRHDEREGRTTMENRRIGRVFLLFTIRDPLTQSLHDVAFVQLFSHSPVPDAASGMYRLKKLPKYDVIEIETIEQSVHLIPKYGDITTTSMADGRSAPALDVWDEFWLNNHSDPHTFNVIY